MSIVVRSPYSGQQVEIREQDVGRAIRDEQGRFFYVLAKQDGSGHYGSATRAGSPKAEQTALELEANVVQHGTDSKSESASSAKTIHNAQGRRRSKIWGRLAIIMLLIIIIAIAYTVMASWPEKWSSTWFNISTTHIPSDRTLLIPSEKIQNSNSDSDVKPKH